MHMNVKEINDFTQYSSGNPSLQFSCVFHFKLLISFSLAKQLRICVRLFSRTAIICNTFPACATATTTAVSLLDAAAYSNRTAEQQQ